jgi:uncharacterized tellurite resistance protein B-like protein
MKAKLKEWFGLDEPEEIETHDIQHAAAALMVEVMVADHDWDDMEVDKIHELLIGNLNLTQAEAQEILGEAANKQQSANDLYQFTSVVNEHYDNDQKFELLKQLWIVAYADAQVDRYEEHMIRKLSDLLHLPHSQFIRAKILARDEMEEDQA